MHPFHNSLQCMGPELALFDRWDRAETDIGLQSYFYRS